MKLIRLCLYYRIQLFHVFLAIFTVFLACVPQELLAAPEITNVEPAPGSTGVPSSSLIRATFSEQMNPQTINNCSFSLARTAKVMRISAYGSHILALNSLGSVMGWGSSANGETTAPVGLTGVASISLGGSHALALKSDGTVVAWGSNTYGQRTVPAGLLNVAAVAAGSYHSLALKSNGTVIAWGDNRYGQISVPAGLAGVVAVSAGDRHSIALKSDGTVVAWGDNSYGQSTVPAGLTGVTAIAAGGSNSAVVKSDGTVAVWGFSYTNNNIVPAGLTGVTALAVGGHVVALKSDGSVVAWGNNNYGQATVPAGLAGVVAVAAGGADTVVLKSDGTMLAWGYNANSQDIIPARNECVSAVSVGGYHSVAVKPDGTITAWGNNVYGQTAVPAGLSEVSAVAVGEGLTVALKSDGTVVNWGQNSRTPPLLSGVTSIAAGGFHGMALKSDGTVSSWGLSVYNETSVPAGLNNVRAISAGYYHSLTLKEDGSLVAWGYNGYGQTTIPAGLNNVTSIASGMHHNLAIKTDGTVSAWGYNSKGQTSVPAGLSGVVAVAAGDEHSVALKADGTVVVWGDNAYGECTVPTGLAEVVAVAAGSGYTLALKSDGTLVGWGDDRYCQRTFPRSPYESPLVSAVSWDAATLTAQLAPAQALPFGATINAVLGGAIRSLTGEKLTAHSWGFSVVNGYLITATVSGSGAVNCTPATPAPGQDVTCSLVPESGYTLADLTDNGVDVLDAVAGGNYLIPAVSGDHALTAAFVQIMYPLTLTISGEGSGVVHSEPAPDIACAAGSCGVSYVDGTSVILTALPNAGSSLATWGGDCTGSEDCRLTMSSSRSVSATFNLLSYAITATAGANGTIAGPATVTYGGSAFYTITPATGYHVADVLVDDASIGAVTGYTFANVTANHTISATFAINTYSITATAGANGSISGPATVSYGGSASYTITPAVGYHVADVLVDDASIGAVTSYNFTDVTTTHTISATFAINTYSITATAEANGSISGPGTVSYGDNASYTITPAVGYHVQDVLVDAVSVGAVTGYTFTNVTANHAISVTFAINTYSITATAGANGSISGPATVSYGGSASYTITPATGYGVATVLVDGISVGAVAAYTFTNVTDNHTISASFAALPDLTVTAVTAPNNGNRGRGISIGATVRNQGGGNAGGFAVTFYLSTDRTISGSDTVLGTVNITSLNAGDTKTASGYFTVPRNMAAGRYYIVAVVDSGGAVVESNEGNNSLAATHTTTIR